MYHILLVEDSLDYQNLVTQILAPIAKVRSVMLISEALSEINIKNFDLILLDIQLPDGEGFEVAAKLQERAENKEVPVIFLTASGEIDHKIKGFKLGAEDYIVKPFNFLEFKARVESRLQKNENRKEQTEILMSGNLQLEVLLQRAILIKENRDLGLTPLEFKILFYLARNKRKVVSREKLVDVVWGKGTHIGRSIDTHINALRRKMGPAAVSIQSSYGKGYFFDEISKT